MASYSQPEDLWVDWIAATEVVVPPGMSVEPANIIQVGNSLKLRTYMFWSGSNIWERNAVKSALEGSSLKVTYYLTNLETGGTPIKIDGGVRTILTPTSTDPEFLADYGGWWGRPNDLGYKFNSAEITSGLAGSGKTLELPSATATEGTWQIALILNGGANSGVSVFSSDMFIQVLK